MFISVNIQEIQVNQIQQVKKLKMKKQAQRSRLQTPPFVEFETVKQRLRISLPQQQAQKLIGLKEMQQINNHKQTFDVKDLIIKVKSKRRQNIEQKNQHGKKKVKGSEKNNLHNKIIQGNQRLKQQLEGKERLSSQFTDKKSAKKQKIKNKSKEKHKDKNKKKKKSRQKDGFIQLKHSEERSKGKYKNLHNFSQCIYPATQDLRQVYNIHVNRQKNTRSYNAQYRTKVSNHRKQLSQCFPLINKSKTTGKKQTEVSKNLYQSKNLTKLTNIQIINQVLKSNSLDSLDYYRFQTNQQQFSQEQSSDDQRQQQKGVKITKNNKILEQLYNSGELNQGESLDSQDQKLLSMISQDTKTMRKKSNIYGRVNKINKQVWVLPIKQNESAQKIQINRHILPQTHKIEKEDIETTCVVKQQYNQTYNHNRLLKTIDSILQQIGNFSNKKANQISKLLENKSQQLNGQMLEEKTIQISDSSNSMSSTLSAAQMSNLTYSKWNSLPSVLELEVILQNCLNQGASLEKSRVIPNNNNQGSKIVDQRLSKQPNRNRKIQFDPQQKWKQNKIKSIQKAKKLLKIGLHQATKLLNLKNLTQNSNKKQLIEINKRDKGFNSNYGQKRIKIKCKSMLSLKYLQNYRHENQKLKKQQKIQDKNRQKLQRIQYQNDQQQINKSQSSIVVMEEVFRPKKQSKIQLQLQIPKIYQRVSLKEQKRQRLSNLNNKQVQQIIQFICLDLYIGFIQQVQIQFENPMNVFQSVYQALSRLRTSKKLGFSTTPKDVYALLQKLSIYLEQTKQKSNLQKTLKLIVFERIKNSLGPKPHQLLKFMRQVEYETQQEPQQQKESFALSSAWFHQFSQKYVNQYDFGVYYFMDEDRQSKRQSFLKNAMHVHNKAIFDSINQMIDKHRPFGVIGQPFPWKKYVKPPESSFKNFNIILNKTFEQVVQNCKYLCGIFSEQHMGRLLSTQQYLEFSEDRLNKILCKDIQDNQVRWNFIDDEQTQVLIQISKYLQMTLLIQTACQIVKIIQKKEKIILLT